MKKDCDCGSEIQMAHRFADLLCSAYGLPAYVSLGRIDPDGYSVMIVGSWAGGVPEEPSKAPYAATAKLAELVWYGQSRGLSLTPVPGLGIGLGWMGGARYDWDVVGVSKWAQEHDRLLALILLYSLEHETTLHHVGFRFISEEAMRVNSAGLVEKLGTGAIEVPAEDHMRLYHPVGDARCPRGVYYVEHQYFPDGPHTHAFHWDLITQNPVQFLTFVAGAYGTEPVWLDPEEHGPMGLVWVVAEKDGTIMGVMARDKWWNVA